MTRRDPLAERLARFGPLAGCSKAELAEVVMRACACPVHRGDRLAVEGASGHELVVMVEGRAQVSGRRRLPAVLAGDPMAVRDLLRSLRRRCGPPTGGSASQARPLRSATDAGSVR